MRDYISAWKGKKVVVVGDIMLDRFAEGVSSRKNPEAPAAHLLFGTNIYDCVGGAANVALNVKALGGKASIHGIIGEDIDGGLLRDHCIGNDLDFYAYADGRKTTTKIRFVETSLHPTQILRYDLEETKLLVGDELENMITAVSADIRDADVVILSDYAKGVFGAKGDINTLGSEVITYCNRRGIPVLVDLKPINLQAFQRCTLVSPNLGEAKGITGLEVKYEGGRLAENGNLQRLCKAVKRRAKSKYVVVTCGGDGIISMDPSGHFDFSHTRAEQLFDVTGAGDTVIATLALSFAAKYKSGDLNIHEATKIANAAAGIVVGNKGTSTVSVEDLEAVLPK